MGLIYIGGFPPPFGGVTTKNENLFTALSEKINISKIDFNAIKRGSVAETLRLAKSLLGRNNRFVVGVAGKKTRKNLCKLMYYINRKSMEKSVIFLMGGTVANDIANDCEYQKYVSAFNCVYAETKSMVATLENAGLKNAGYYPNCRFRPERIISSESQNSKNLKCVFFSLIRKEKGADIVFEVAQINPEIDVAFYGPVEESYKNEFFAELQKHPNVTYYGVFSGEKDEVYKELAKFDILLFPTRYDIEGVPGILVESKIAGITCIVSDKSYNSELVKNDIEGIVLEECTATAISSVLKVLGNDSQMLDQLKKNNKISANHYYIDNYINEIIDKITSGGGNK